MLITLSKSPGPLDLPKVSGLSLTPIDGLQALSMGGKIIATLYTRDEPWDRELAPPTGLGAPMLCRSLARPGPRGWHDGPIAHWNAAGQLVNFVPTGLAASLAIPLAELDLRPKQEMTTKEDPAQRALRSHIAAFVHSAPCGSTTTLANFDLRSAVALVLLRRARPELRQVMHKEFAPQNWPPTWKRLCQNLGVAPTVADGTHTMLPDELVEPRHLDSLIQAIQARSAILPVSLAVSRP